MKVSPLTGLSAVFLSRTGEKIGPVGEEDLAIQSDLDLNSIAYFNGEYIPLKDAKVSVASQAFQYGTNSFEGICGFWNEEENQIYIFRLEDHYRRFAKTAKVLGFDVDQHVRELCDITCEVVRRNKSDCDTYIRPNIYQAGFVAGPTLLNPQGENPAGLSIFSRPIRKRPDVNKGLHLMISDWVKPANNMIPAWAKIGGHYVMSSHAKSQAVQKGFDDALFLNADGNVTEASATNIFALKDGKLYTPPATDSILSGVTRDSMIEIARNELGIETVEGSFGAELLLSSDEVSVTGTLAGARPITKIDNKPVKNGEVGPITRKLCELYFDIASGKLPKYKHWCTPVF